MVKWLKFGLPIDHDWAPLNFVGVDKLEVSEGKMALSPNGVIQAILRRANLRLVRRERDFFTLRTSLNASSVRTIFDVGANVGNTCAEWLQSFPDAQVHAIEPLDEHLRAIKRLAVTAGTRLHIWPYAASDLNGKIRFFEQADHTSSSSMYKSTSESHELLPFTAREVEREVEAVTLDSLILDNSIAIERSCLVKIDVQGAEDKVLRGSSKLLNSVDYVMVEINLQNLYDGQAEFSEIVNLLHASGLKFAGALEQFHSKNGTAIFTDALFARR